MTLETADCTGPTAVGEAATASHPQGEGWRSLETVDCAFSATLFCVLKKWWTRRGAETKWKAAHLGAATLAHAGAAAPRSACDAARRRYFHRRMGRNRLRRWRDCHAL